MCKKSSNQEDEVEDEDPVPTPTTQKTKSQRPASQTPTPGIKDTKTRSQRPASKKTPARKPITENDGLAFPGVPKKKVGPVQLECMAIYTDISSQKWRVKRHGERQDKTFSFKSDAAENWNRLRVYVMGG